jgi:hypothetical protein
MNGMPLINGIAYSWGEIAVNIAGVSVTGITAVEYDDDQEVTNNYGAGRYPVSRSKGRITCTAKISLDIEEVRAITNQIPNRRLQDTMPFDIVVSYLKEEDPAKIHHDIIKNCSFKKNGRAWAEGDTRKVVELDLIPSHIIWG